MNFFKRYFSTILLAIVIPLAVATFPITLQKLYITLKQPATIAGMVGFVVLYYQLLRSRMSMFQTLDHELSHAGVSLLFGNKVTELKATDRMGGHVMHQGTRHNFLISLAPYIWRVPTIVVAFVIWLLNRNQPEWYYLVVFGAVFAYRNISIFEEARPHQTDLTKVGLARAYLWIVCLNVLWLGIIATAMLNNYGIEDYLQDVWQRLKVLVIALVAMK